MSGRHRLGHVDTSTVVWDGRPRHVSEILDRAHEVQTWDPTGVRVTELTSYIPPTLDLGLDALCRPYRAALPASQAPRRVVVLLGFRLQNWRHLRDPWRLREALRAAQEDLWVAGVPVAYLLTLCPEHAGDPLGEAVEHARRLMRCNRHLLAIWPCDVTAR